MHSVQEIDRGWYMCQINTDPMVHRSGYLEVVGKSTEMEFLDINLTKDSSLCSMLFTIFLLAEFKKKTDSTVVKKNTKKSTKQENSSLFVNSIL